MIEQTYKFNRFPVIDLFWLSLQKVEIVNYCSKKKGNGSK